MLDSRIAKACICVLAGDCAVIPLHFEHTGILSVGGVCTFALGYVVVYLDVALTHRIGSCKVYQSIVPATHTCGVYIFASSRTHANQLAQTQITSATSPTSGRFAVDNDPLTLWVFESTKSSDSWATVSMAADNGFRLVGL